MNKRGSGILLHITSLPSPYGIGDLGPDACRFIDFLAGTNQKYWQILPLNQTSTVYGNSPYSSFSAFAGNSLLISPELLVSDGILKKSEIHCADRFPDDKVNYKAVLRYKKRILDTAYEKNKGALAGDRDFERFCGEHSYWLDDYCIFISIKNRLNGIDWGQWPQGLRDRSEGEIGRWSRQLGDMVLREKFNQFVFFKQWSLLKSYCSSKDIQIIGDMPIYVNYDSADVWAHPELFNLDGNKRPTHVAGVPPDYFSPTGQLWGHPLYRWDFLKESHYAWWIRRLEHNLRLFHMFRLDHFRGFVGYWSVPSDEKTAINGSWVAAPARDFFTAMFRHFPYLPLIAEDLGVITPDVREIMDIFGFPGMKVLLFAFGDDVSSNPYAPHNHVKNCVVYTGTHDNNTIKGWYRSETGPEVRDIISRYIGRSVSLKTVCWEFIRMGMMSVADIVIIPMQDILCLGGKARMNLPASSRGNWQWRLSRGQLTETVGGRLREMTRIYGRS